MLSLFVAVPALAVPGPDAVWEVLSSGDPRIECTEAAGGPWCRSTGTVPLPIDKVAITLENMAAYQTLFESIISIKVLAPEVMHITLDYPAPLSDRDYVARYTRSQQGEARIYRWEPVTHVGAPEVNGIVRLPKMAGEWRLEPAGEQTRVIYLWHAEIAGSFPNWAMSTARKKAGSEALKDIRQAAAAASKGS